MTIKDAKSLTALKNTQTDDEIMWSLYVVQTRFGHWYTGISTNVSRRFAEHQAGTGAKNLRGKGPLTLIFQQQVGSRSAATKLEIKIKRLTKAQKREYVNSSQTGIKTQ
ncbi:GIY-YIG nuclease family protein [Pseudoalteromonas sp. ZZD1]|uniref:GIY-YIG nuclease family protein n=1 Tax=Pseudoalteromonas sp. ZZD1 TaxID=3139395 RepID=UPI003BABF4B0